ncbi:Hypothetical predicted protein, partial [Paramuricea clavata]
NDANASPPEEPSASARKIGTPEPQRRENTEVEAIVNRRLVYANVMRSAGCGAYPLKGYASHNKALLKAAKEVCHETLSDAAREIHVLKDKSEDEVADCDISCDGTSRR